MGTVIIAFILLGIVSFVVGLQCPPAIKIDQQPQVFVMSDISNEPDDTMSFVRLLLHSDQYNITGMVAVTSYWQNSSVFPDQILNVVQAYGKVVDNLNVHTSGKFPSVDYLTAKIKSGQPLYGTSAVGRWPLSSGASHFIEVVDGLVNNDLLHVQAWGGVNMLAESLSYVRSSRTSHDLHNFLSKIRKKINLYAAISGLDTRTGVYAISDQDSAGPWIRSTFPSLSYIVSLHGFNQYGMAAWPGISGEKYYNFDHNGPDSSLVTQSYISKNFQIGPLGSLYPNIAYIMEGDSPSILHTMMNGANGGPFDHPEWGGWGGRYEPQDLTRQSNVYSDARDSVVGQDNSTIFTSNHATIWRWRRAFQNEMSARVQWSVKSSRAEGSHPPVVTVNGSCGSEPLILEVKPGESVLLDGSGTYDPDTDGHHEKGGRSGRNALGFRWWHYREITATQSNVAAEVPELNFTLSDGGRVAMTTLPDVSRACAALMVMKAAKGARVACQQYHVIFEVTGSGNPPIGRYKRIILKVEHSPEDGPWGTDEL